MAKKNREIVAKNWPFVVVGCIIAQKNKILLVQEGQKERGKWNQPAGWLEKYENPIEAAQREAEEETGFKIKIRRFLGVYSLDRRKVKGWLKSKTIDLHVLKLIFTAKIENKRKIYQNNGKNEILKIKWFSLSEIKKLERNNLLRDPDIFQEAKDYFSGRGCDLKMVCHTKCLMK